MAVRLEILTNATVTLISGKQKEYEAIYPTHNGLVIGNLISETGIFEKSCRRRFGLSKPIEKKLVHYLVFCDQGFIKGKNYTFFTGIEQYAYTQKLTNSELLHEFY